MLPKILFLILFISVICQASCFGQSGEQPNPPLFEYLSVDPLTGIPTLVWSAPQGSDSNPDPTGYIIYKRVPNLNVLFPYDTVDYNTFSYKDLDGNAGLGPLSYTLASDGVQMPSEQTLEHFTIHLTAQYDSCANNLNLEWTHYYVKQKDGEEVWEQMPDYYKVFLGNDLTLNSFEQVDSVPGGQTFSIIKVEPNQQINMFIKANRKGNYSTSNLFSISTRIAQPPEFMFIDSIIARQEQTDLHFTIDNTTDFQQFSIIRWEQPDSASARSSEKTLFEFIDPNTISFSDNADLWALRSNPYYYRINAYDGCNRLKRVSNLSNSMILRAFNRGLLTNLEWTSFYSAKRNPIIYKLYRIKHISGASRSELIYQVENPTQFEFNDNISQLQGQGFSPTICYYIEAYEIIDGLSEKRLSRSGMVCTDVIPDVAMPNAIDPMSNISLMGGHRNLFAPTFTFETDFKLYVYNRWGGIVFSGDNKGWDGRFADGQYAREGSYVYRLEVYPKSMRMYTKTGTVTVIYGSPY